MLLDQSVLGWGEFELEVMRDRNDNVVIVCSIENVDPMGVHTGDSVTVAPQQTLTDRLYQRLRDQAIAVIRAVGVETGGSNVQFAVNPETEEILVIEMNPRVSRSSALASKATGFPIAKIAARLAVGYTLEEIDNDITQVTPASFEPTIDYVVVKWPRFAFEKFPRRRPAPVDAHEVASARRWRSGARSSRPSPRRCAAASSTRPPTSASADARVAARMARAPRRRPLRRDPRGPAARRERRSRSTSAAAIDPWFLRELRELALDPDAPFAGERIVQVRRHLRRRVRGAHAVLLLGLGARRRADEVERGDRESVVILGAGPNRIGQGIEFDYCCVHAAMTVRDSGRDAVMINCNPETVSTDYDTSDRLYFEPLTLEDVLAVCEVERPQGVIVQFGGQTPLKLAAGLAEAGVPLLGTSVDAIDLAEDRGRFGELLDAARLRGAAVRDRAARSTQALDAARARRLPAARAPQLRARRPRDGDRLLASRTSTTTCSRDVPAHGPRRSSSTASWRTRSRSTSTRCATARTSGSAGSCSTSRRPASTPATAPACCRRTRSARRCSSRSASRRRASRSGSASSACSTSSSPSTRGAST